MPPLKHLSDYEIERMRDHFTIELHENYERRVTKQGWDLKRIATIIHKIEEFAKDPVIRNRNTNSYYYYHMYDIKMLDGKKVLTYKKNASQNSNKIIRIVPTEEYFDILLDAHLETEHGGRKKMSIFLKDKVIIPVTAIALFQKHCAICESKKAVPRSIQPVSTGMARDYKRGTLHIVNMSDTPDKREYETYNYILYYQDHMTKFSYLRELPDDSTSTVADALLHIYLGLGGPEILSTTRDTEFTEDLIECLTKLLPDSLILIGKPIMHEVHDECDDNIRAKIQSWMKEHNSTNWSLGIHFVQFELNNTYVEEFKRTPFKAMFGVSQKNGVNEKNMPKEVYVKMKTEDDLKKWQTSQRQVIKRRHILKKKRTEEAEKSKNKDQREERKSSDREDSPVPGASVAEKSDWCWVCGKDEGVTDECHSCNGAIHKDCGKYKDGNILCNLCVAEEECPKEEAIEIKMQTNTFEFENVDIPIKNEIIEIE